MRTTKALLLLFFIAAFSQSGFSKDVYLRFENSCMNRLEYAKSDNSRHIVYQLKKNDQERIILEVGNEAANYNSYLPTATVTCQNLQINESFAREINNGTTRLFIVRPASGGFTVSPVKSADFFYNTEKEIGFSSSEGFVFVYNLNVRARGINLATKDSNAKVYFRGTQANSCPTRYYFRKVSKENYQPYTDMVIVPKIGVLERLSGLDATQASKNKLTLVKFNDIQINKFLAAVCNGYEDNLVTTSPSTGTTTPPVATPGTGSTPTRNRLEELESSGNTAYQPPTNTGTTDPTTSPNTSYNPTLPPNVSRCTIYKDVDRNLYIDRNTGLPANGLCGGNTYQNGYMMDNSSVVTTPTNPQPEDVFTQPTGTTGTTTSTTPSTTGTVTTRVNNCGIVNTQGTHVVLQDETLYSISRMYKVSVPDLKRWNNIRNVNFITPCTRLKVAEDYVASRGSEVVTSADGVHIVKRNETLYSIAKAYGYTAEKMAEMNGIRPGEVIYIGQRLKTKDCNCPSPTATTPSPYDIPATVRLTDKGQSGEPGQAEAELIPSEYDATVTRTIHIVKENDTIFSIARMYNTSVSRIRDLNNLEKTEIIIPFQKLYVN